MGQEVTRLGFHRQRGAAILLFVVGMFLIIATLSALKLLMPAQRGANQAEVTGANFLAIQNAIFAYVAVNGYLPCPANPLVANNGLSDPVPPNPICNTPGGVVPWTTLGIAPETALDGWNRRISFRVFSGATGLTQLGGANLASCDTSVSVVPPLLDAGGLCNLAHTNLDTQFLVGKGLGINDSGNLVSGAAFVLLSHGESGYGAYLPGGGRVQLPALGSDELTNTGTVSPYVRKEHSAPGIDAALVAHFDDVVAWTTIMDLATKSGRQARDW